MKEDSLWCFGPPLTSIFSCKSGVVPRDPPSYATVLMCELLSTQAKVLGIFSMYQPISFFQDKEEKKKVEPSEPMEGTSTQDVEVKTLKFFEIYWIWYLYLFWY